MTYNTMAIEQDQIRLAIEHKQRMIARQAEIDSVESVIMKSDTLALAQDTIRIALKTAGYSNVDNMTQFERASAILDMAQELATLTTVRESVSWSNGRGYNGKVAFVR